MMLTDIRPEFTPAKNLMLKIGSFDQASPQDINVILNRVKELAQNQSAFGAKADANSIG